MKKNVGVVGLMFPNPVMVVGTYDLKGNPNVITLAWGGIASSDPASISIAVRPSRYSHEALVHNKAFTVNLPTVQYVAETDFFGITSGRKVNKLAATGLTPVRADHVNAPYIQEFPYALECEVTHTLDLGAHTLFIGEVKGTHVDESLLDASGKVSWEGVPFLTFDAMAGEYRAPGEKLANAYQVGKTFINR